MEQNKNLDAFLNLVSDEPSGWLQKAQWRQENKEWLDRSAKIAVRILSQLRDNKKMSKCPANQRELAELMGKTPQYINKIVKGSENLTLESIAHLEAALQTPLLDDVSSETNTAFLVSSTVSYVSVTQTNSPFQLFDFDFETMEVKMPPAKNTTDTAPTDYAYAMAA